MRRHAGGHCARACQHHIACELQPKEDHAETKSVQSNSSTLSPKQTNKKIYKYKATNNITMSFFIPIKSRMPQLDETEGLYRGQHQDDPACQPCKTTRYRLYSPKESGQASRQAEIVPLSSV